MTNDYTHLPTMIPDRQVNRVNINPGIQQLLRGISPRDRVQQIRHWLEVYLPSQRVVHHPIALALSDLQGMDLRDVDLSFSNLNRANLSNANLSQSNLSHSNLTDANLRCANLTDANLTGANLTGANLNGADLSHVQIDTSTLLPPKWSLVWRILNQIVTGEDFSNSNLSHSYLASVNLSHTNLAGANLSYAYLSGANFSSTNLNGANLSGAYVRDVDWSDAIVVNTLLIGCVGISADLQQNLAQRGAIFRREC